MKFKNIYKFIGLMVLFITLQSRSGGPGISPQALQVTGAPGSTGSVGTCGNNGCHTAGAFSPSLSIQLLDGTDAVTAYQPGKTYTVKIVNTPGNGTPARYGFQAVTLDGNDAQAGAWEPLSGALHTVELSNRSYAEHSAPSPNGTFELEWTAPAAGTGNVTVYAASLASNNNGNTAGDGVASSTLALTESQTSSTSAADEKIASLKVLPNPVGDRLNLEISSLLSGNFRIRIMDVKGQEVSYTPVDVQAGQQLKSVDVAALPPGMYVVQLCGNEHLAAVQMMKK
ncbi:MAG TPA: T9SS type A sorting domain-containing protein [Bacteroidetes bacterium]|nr:T9SS type A sorting domain-containing protein [Bacteroidota bacterium]